MAKLDTHSSLLAAQIQLLYVLYATERRTEKGRGREEERKE